MIRSLEEDPFPQFSFPRHHNLSTSPKVATPPPAEERSNHPYAVGALVLHASESETATLMPPLAEAVDMLPEYRQQLLGATIPAPIGRLSQDGGGDHPNNNNNAEHVVRQAQNGAAYNDDPAVIRQWKRRLRSEQDAKAYQALVDASRPKRSIGEWQAVVDNHHHPHTSALHSNNDINRLRPQSANDEDNVVPFSAPAVPRYAQATSSSRLHQHDQHRHHHAADHHRTLSSRPTSTPARRHIPNTKATQEWIDRQPTHRTPPAGGKLQRFLDAHVADPQQQQPAHNHSQKPVVSPQPLSSSSAALLAWSPSPHRVVYGLEEHDFPEIVSTASEVAHHNALLASTSTPLRFRRGEEADAYVRDASGGSHVSPGDVLGATLDLKREELGGLLEETTMDFSTLTGVIAAASPPRRRSVNNHDVNHGGSPQFSGAPQQQNPFRYRVPLPQHMPLPDHHGSFRHEQHAGRLSPSPSHANQRVCCPCCFHVFRSADGMIHDATSPW